MNVLGCGGPNHSGVYAEVETVLNWVKENSGSNCGGSNPTAAPTNPPTEGPNPTTEGPNPTTEGPNPTTESPDACQGSWIGDGECDDINNTEECQWDGGDCCGDSVVTDHCSACECLDPDPDRSIIRQILNLITKSSQIVKVKLSSLL